MITIENRQFGIPYAHVWFAKRPSIADAFRLTTFKHCAHLGSVPGFVRNRKFTKIIDLDQPAGEILKTVSKNAAYKIRRAEREGVTVERVESRDEFLEFFNAFARSKNRATIGAGQLGGWGRETIALAAIRDSEPLAMHSYIVDASASRACLLHSASHFRRSDDSKARNFIGMANRLLHYKAMLYFIENSIAKYDMGGYAALTTDEELLNINSFKDEFGGTLVEESTYRSYPMAVLSSLSNLKSLLNVF